MSDRTCFVIMGFSEKTAHYKAGEARVLDMDATYEAIIKPAVVDAGLECIRADEVLHSGVIDDPMYRMLLRSDLVVADISTANVNAVYELGVRHALRPARTIMMIEDRADFSFDLNHTATFTYEHLGKDIGAREAASKKAALQALIEEVMAKNDTDSPVYTYLVGLEPPSLRGTEKRETDGVEAGVEETPASLIAKGNGAKKLENFPETIIRFSKAKALIEKNADESGRGLGAGSGTGSGELDYVVQQLALATYKQKSESETQKLLQLEEALEIISGLNPARSQDTETLGIAGAIRKRLWDMGHARPHLELAVEHYGRGWELTKDHYNGENYATCLMMRSQVQEDEGEALFNRMTAKKVRQEIVKNLGEQIASDAFSDLKKDEQMWRHATMANCLFALGRGDDAEASEAKFKALSTADWQVETYEKGKATVLAEG